MVSSIKNDRIENTIIVFFIIICSLIVPLKSFTYFKAHSLLSSNYILLITDEGILKYDSQLNQYNIIQNTNLITNNGDIYYISFAQSPLDEGGYIYCRLKNFIFIYDESFNSYGSFEIGQELNHCVLNPYRTKGGNDTLIVTCINNEQLKSIIYKINLNDAENPASVLVEKDGIKTLNSKMEETSVLNTGISCELMNSSSHTNKLLVCFATDCYNYLLNAILINPENSLEIVSYSNNFKNTGSSLNIRSVLKPNQKESIICFTDIKNSFLCLTYDIESNEFTNIKEIIGSCMQYPFDLGVNYLKEKN